MDAANRPLAPGELLRIGNSRLHASIAPAAGGRIASITRDGLDWLCGHGEGNQAAIAWGSYPMVPWAGRVRQGRFRFEGSEYTLPANLGAHAIHGVGFVLPWQVESHTSTDLRLSLELPRDASWPFGGTVRQHIAIDGASLRQEMALTAGDLAMPGPLMGWHPWFRKPDRLLIDPAACYPRDAEGITTLPPARVPPPPWDDCFINTTPVLLERAGQRLRLTSDCIHWVVFDERAHATCVEPQTGPPDGFNLRPEQRLDAGATAAAWFLMEWL